MMYVVNPRDQRLAENDTLEIEAWLAKFQQAFEASAWARKWNGNRRTARRPCARLVHLGPQLLGELPVPLARFGRGDLKGDGEERFFIAFGAAAKHREDLLRVRQRA
jgi:hypothetical protein